MRRASVALLVATAFARAVGSEPMEEEPEEEELLEARERRREDSEDGGETKETSADPTKAKSE